MVRSMVAASMSGSHGVVHQHNVVGLSGQSVQGVGHRFLAPVAAFDHADAPGKAEFGYLGFDALHLSLAYSHVHRCDARHGSEGAQRVDEDGHAIQREKLLGLRAGHPGSQPGGGKNDKDLHDSASIAPRRVETWPARYHPLVPTRPTRTPATSLPLDTSLLRPGLRLAVGLSGGADSVALVRALAARSGELGLVLHAAHLHHGLRGAEADGDLAFSQGAGGKAGPALPRGARGHGRRGTRRSKIWQTGRDN